MLVPDASIRHHTPLSWPFNVRISSPVRAEKTKTVRVVIPTTM